MTAISFEATRLRALGIEVERFRHSDQELGEPAWAHVSGWAQLSGTPRRISCVLTCRDDAASLGRLLPDVSDTLTELGFPWELTIIDNPGMDGSGAVLSKWTELPGFNWMRLAKDYGEAAAVWAGLCNARGDAVILINASDDPPLERLSELVDQWELGNEIVALERDSGDGSGSVVNWSQECGDIEQFRRPCPNPLKNAYRLILLDRRAVDSLIQSRPGPMRKAVV